ncbi:uncharacterized protein LOC127744911 [Arachis duranensis]|uniref:Uncharacterized protein LOC127744911 n=1 Tax=Arachis duranensis TaxID=130453 RepID=A0A9C6TGJ1_ARADU|nr:uncharacterized protein LOC127744911 [Arachis duranensis]
MVFDEIHGYSLTSINPFLDDSSPKDHAFVDEFSCIDSNYLVFVKEESVGKLPINYRRNEVSIKSVTILAEVEFGRCITPIVYVTKFTAIPAQETKWKYFLQSDVTKLDY